MKSNFNKLITVCLLFSFCLFNVFGAFANVTVASANNNVVDEEVIFGSLINGSQGGRTRGGGSSDIKRVGNHMIGGQRKSGRRLGLTPSRGETAFNPSTVDINLLYIDYVDFYDSIDSPSHLIIPINKTLEHSKHWERNTPARTQRVRIRNPEINDYPLNVSYDLNYTYSGSYQYAHIMFNNMNPSEDLGGIRVNLDAIKEVGGPHVVRKNIPRNSVITIDVLNSNLHNVEYVSTYLDTVILSNERILDLERIETPHYSGNLPTKEEFITNYENTFNVTYDNSTNQLIENNTLITYNTSDFFDNSVTVNNQYLTNNYTIINDDPISERLDYTNLFQRMINAIKDLPQQIRDKFDDFSGGGGSSEPPAVEEGKGFWASLFDAVAALVTSLSDFITSIPQIILDLLDGLLGLVEKIVELFIPTAEQMDELKQSFSGLTDDLSFKFSPITESVESIKTVFSSPKSIYTLTYDFNGQTINVIPIQLQNQINNFKSVLNGVVVLTTFISIYKRFVGREDVIK